MHKQVLISKDDMYKNQTIPFFVLPLLSRKKGNVFNFRSCMVQKFKALPMFFNFSARVEQDNLGYLNNQDDPQ
jgi:hypothetical protein